MIIITGIPGSGKTTLAKRLMQDVGVRGVAQDAVKEFLADHLGGTYTDQQSSALGRVTRRAVLELGVEFEKLGEQIIIESALQTSAAEEILQHSPHRPILQIYVTCGLAEVKRRFYARKQSGHRHSVHTDDLYDKLTEHEIRDKYRPLVSDNITTVIVDSENLDYAALRDTVKDFLMNKAITKENEI